MGNLTVYWNMILTQRSWSWAVVAIAYLLLVMLIKSFFFRSLLKRAKALNSKWFQEIKKVYLKKCLGGWVLLTLSLLLLIFFWQSANLQEPSMQELAMIFLIFLVSVLSILAHIVAFGMATLHVLKQLENNQMTF